MTTYSSSRPARPATAADYYRTVADYYRELLDRGASSPDDALDLAFGVIVSPDEIGEDDVTEAERMLVRLLANLRLATDSL